MEQSFSQLWHNREIDIVFLLQSPVSLTLEVSGPNFPLKKMEVPKKEIMQLQSECFRRLQFSPTFNAMKVDWSLYREEEEESLSEEGIPLIRNNDYCILEEIPGFYLG